MKYQSKYGKELENLILKTAKNSRLLHEFLIDLLSPGEYKEFAVRLQIVKMLGQNKSHRQISKALKVGVATITRGVRELANKNGGFAKILKKY